MTVKEIVEAWLKEHGYDGLWNENGECGCLVGSDLMNCECEGLQDCKPGFKVKCDPEMCPANGDCEYHIGPKKDEEPKD